MKRTKPKSQERSPPRAPTQQQNEKSMALMHKQMEIMQQRILGLENENRQLKEIANQKDQRIYLLEQICHN